jgi:DNA-binding MarR family transcriptional regulator
MSTNPRKRAGVLTEAETRIWHAWKIAGENVMERVARDVQTATGLSGPDYGILSRLSDLGSGSLRQVELQVSMNWEASRMSHHIRRMELRGLVDREASGRSMVVEMSREGWEILDTARPVHAQAVRRYLLERVGASHLGVFEAICERLAAVRSDGEHEQVVRRDRGRRTRVRQQANKPRRTGRARQRR